MKKMESAEIVIEQEGYCIEPKYIPCEECFLKDKDKKCKTFDFKKRVKLAKEYINKNKE